MTALIRPRLRYHDDGIDGTGPGLWYGKDAPNGAAAEWLRAPVGSFYFHQASTTAATAYVKTAATGADADWIPLAGSVLLGAAAAAGATQLTTANLPEYVAVGHWLVLDAFSSSCEVRRITTLTSGVAGFATALSYTHTANAPILHVTTGELNALWFGASPSATAATNGTAFARMVAQAKIDDNPRKMYIPGASDAYEYDTTIVLSTTGAATYGFTLRGDGAARRGEVYSHGTVLYYKAVDASNGIEIGNGTHACRSHQVRDLTLRCNRAGGHTGCGILARYTGYSSDMICNVSVTLAYVGIRTQDCWGSTMRNVDVSFCDLGASINGMNSGAWIGGGARSCYGEAAVKLGDAVDQENGNLVFCMANLTFEGNTADSIWVTRTATVETAINHHGLTFDNLYFEANGGTYDIKLGAAASGVGIAVVAATIRNCTFEKHVYIGCNVRSYLFGPNRHDTGDGYVLEAASGSAEGIIIGPAALIKTATNSFYGTTHRITFIDSDTGISRRGISGIASSYNNHTLLATPLLTAAAITAGTADWRALAGATVVKINHAEATDFTEIANCPDYTLLLLKFVTANTTIKHDVAKIVLYTGADWNPPANAVLTLLSDGGVLYEVSRSVLPA